MGSYDMHKRVCFSFGLQLPREPHRSTRLMLGLETEKYPSIVRKKIIERVYPWTKEA